MLWIHSSCLDVILYILKNDSYKLIGWDTHVTNWQRCSQYLHRQSQDKSETRVEIKDQVQSVTDAAFTPGSFGAFISTSLDIHEHGNRARIQTKTIQCKGL